MKSLDEVRRAFAALPERVTTRQIADATGRRLESVQRNWTRRPDFPAGTGTGRALRRERDQVLAWYEEQSFASEERTGPRDLAERARDVLPLELRLNGPQLAEVLRVHPSLVIYYAGGRRADSTDPFPPTDGQGLRSWPQVRAWVLRQEGAVGEDEAPVKAGEMIQASAGGGHALAATAGWLAQQLGVAEDTALQILTANSGHRLRRTALAKEIGISPDMVKYYARTWPADSTDPFPPTDEHDTRDIAAVKDWLTRHGRKDPAQVLAELADLGELVTVGEIAATAGVPAGRLRTWAGQPGFPPPVRSGRASYRNRDQIIAWYRAQHGLESAGTEQQET